MAARRIPPPILSVKFPSEPASGVTERTQNTAASQDTTEAPGIQETRETQSAPHAAPPAPVSPAQTPRYDRFGFEIKQLEGTDAESKKEKERRKKESAREKKWIKMISHWQRYLGKKPEKVLRRVEKGIPDKLRGRVWQMILKADVPDGELTFVYMDLVSKTSTCEAEIQRDIRRTFPSHSFFTEYQGYISLFNVLKAYSIYDKELGYCQGMGFITGLFLIYMTEEESFRLLVALMQDKGIYRVRGLYMPGLPSIGLFMFQFSKLLENFVPAVFHHLREVGVDSSMFCPQWFIGIFLITFPFELSVRIWDSFIASGKTVLFQVAIALLKMAQGELTKLSFEKTLEFLKEIPPQYLVPDRVIETSSSIIITHQMLQILETEYSSVKAMLPALRQ